jgi:hypothetical protein
MIATLQAPRKVRPAKQVGRKEWENALQWDAAETRSDGSHWMLFSVGDSSQFRQVEIIEGLDFGLLLPRVETVKVEGQDRFVIIRPEEGAPAGVTDIELYDNEVTAHTAMEYNFLVLPERPRQGDVVRVCGSGYYAAKPGDFGMVDFCYGSDDVPGVCLHFSSHRPYPNKHSVSISGGPTPAVKVTSLKSTGYLRATNYWKWWDDLSGGGRGETYNMFVPMWEWNGEED